MLISSAVATVLAIVLIVAVGLVSFLVIRHAVRVFAGRFLAARQTDDPALVISGAERVKRIETACDMLAKGKRRPCCFDRSGMYGKSMGCPVADVDENESQ